MKTGNDPRHQERREIIKELFAYSFYPKNETKPKTATIIKNLKKIDKTIEKVAPEFPVANLNRVDLAILRLAIFELLIEKKTPPRVVIDEAIELGKEFGSETSPRFINGALGAAVKLMDKERDIEV